jgi:hypothetical protein
MSIATLGTRVVVADQKESFFWLKYKVSGAGGQRCICK